MEAREGEARVRVLAPSRTRAWGRAGLRGRGPWTGRAERGLGAVPDAADQAGKAPLPTTGRSPQRLSGVRDRERAVGGPGAGGDPCQAIVRTVLP
ncbi:hypothetical protein JCM4814A_93300 [Streptomyces phaeofaciens JCM 4814]|uniref:Uncharacterized protein n=1 Tax=Streptomyces phaeofaciens TaxID=68254 RepID=A0A918LXU1_9ACTN|nr:hypothetical protein GCM10010226_56640 [Streptomyces phaeofaciens]